MDQEGPKASQVWAYPHLSYIHYINTYCPLLDVSLSLCGDMVFGVLYSPPNFPLRLNDTISSYSRRTLYQDVVKCMYNIIIMDLALFQMILGITISVATVITISATGVRWLVRHYFDDIKKELKPNSGSSLKDQVTRLETDILDLKVQNQQGERFHEKLDDKIDKLTELFVQYVAKNK